CVINFRLERDSKGNLRPPSWVVEGLTMKIPRGASNEHVFMRLPGITWARLRWFEGYEFEQSFYDSTKPPASGLMDGDGRAWGYAVFVHRASGWLALPANASLSRAPGVLSL